MNAPPDVDSEAVVDSANADAPHTQFIYLRGIRREVKDWAACWGGLENWPAHLSERYTAAVELGSVVQWANYVMDHARVGRQYLGRMQHMEGGLPASMQMIRELWRLSMEVLDILYRGLGILETRANLIDCDIEHPDFNLLSDPNAVSYDTEDSASDMSLSE